MKNTSLVVELLICFALILTGATIQKPPGWWVLGLGVLALVGACLGWFPGWGPK